MRNKVSRKLALPEWWAALCRVAVIAVVAVGAIWTFESVASDAEGASDLVAWTMGCLALAAGWGAFVYVRGYEPNRAARWAISLIELLMLAVPITLWGALSAAVLIAIPIWILATGIRLGVRGFVGAMGAGLALAGVGLAIAWPIAPMEVMAMLMAVSVLPVAVYVPVETLRKRLADTVVESARQRQHLAKVSHDMRSPLNVIMLHASMIDREGLPGVVGDQIDTMEESSGHLLRLVNDLMEGSSATRGMVNLQPCDFAIHHLIDHLQRAMGPLASKAGIVLTWTVDPRIPTLYASKRHIEQVVTNLVTNALHYTHAGGKVHVSILRGEHSGPEDEVNLVISVADSGIGMSSDQVAKCWAAFSQVADSAGRGSGVGLGLSICKEISDAMGGEIRVRSVKGEGSVFTWSLTVKMSRLSAEDLRSRQQSARKAREDHRANVQPIRVLVVDDNRANLEAHGKLLRSCGHEVEVRSDGRAGLTAIRSKAFDMVLLDLHMPGMDGEQVMAALREDGGAHPPIALVSGLTDEERARELLGLGARWFFSKPVQPEELLAAIEQRSREVHESRARLL